MASAPSPVMVLVEEIVDAGRAIERGADARVVMARLRGKARLINERNDFCESVMRVGRTGYTERKWDRLPHGWDVLDGGKPDGPKAA